MASQIYACLHVGLLSRFHVRVNTYYIMVASASSLRRLFLSQLRPCRELSRIWRWARHVIGVSWWRYRCSSYLSAAVVGRVHAMTSMSVFLLAITTTRQLENYPQHHQQQVANCNHQQTATIAVVNILWSKILQNSLCVTTVKTIISATVDLERESVNNNVEHIWRFHDKQ